MPDKKLMVFSEQSAMKGFFDDLKKEYKELKPTTSYIGRYARRPPSLEYESRITLANGSFSSKICQRFAPRLKGGAALSHGFC
uniref:Uncharacterized protein n=1 Tax=Candidatus Kentrum sp. TUN TaxID=2126343 RepID=A0A450ZTJ0_9GAMM|nr:MAG: hypothetical protein BECKTUN1418D_GA0071000_10597 [Candidatus Kentron sp. TUN]